MRYTMDQIEVFIACADAGSFSAAARRLRRSQSTVSAAIANLEVAFGADLFDRSSKMPALTSAGETLLVEARDLLDRAITLESHADSLADGNPSRVTLAVDVPPRLLTSALHDFAARYPHIDVDVQHIEHADLAQMLIDGPAELAVCFALPRYPLQVAFHQMGRLIMAHVAHRDHPLARRESVSFADLRAYRHLTHTTHSHQMPTTEYLQAAQTWRAEDYPTVIAMLLGGLGWATVPRQLILAELDRGDLIDLQLSAYPFTDYLVGVDLLWSTGTAHSAAVRWLRDRLRAEKITEIGPAEGSTTHPGG